MDKKSEEELNQKKKVGRPPNNSVLSDKQLNLLRRLAEIQCTEEEIYSAMGFSERHFRQYIKGNPDYALILEEGRKAGNASLRRLQWRAAELGSVPMLIFLGKQYLNQSDKSEVVAKDNLLEKISDDQAVGIARALIERKQTWLS